MRIATTTGDFNAYVQQPMDTWDALRMLHSLSGRWHQVYTGVTVVDANGKAHSAVDGTDVRFEAMSDEAIRRYISTGEPMDKAGAYAIQGGAGAFVSGYEGSRTNVIGLPVELLDKMLRGMNKPAR